ncbi:MAG: DUF2442 domain-containing protein [Desulfitobacteriaceae bacterium]|nr:DUF2442 domain-containing protein [Desulfitobacteriaceae bacterium]MDD4345401.1 DUF2442 domain-containing protein [Desulfitobacteriaceae bacterium]MDD4401486.1 DUF2442 domain-containing protein [Desulfitobacteriaceae bacterium]
MEHLHAVIPLLNYRLLMEFDTGSSITVDLSSKLKTARFAELADEKVFNNVKADREAVIWGDGVLKIPLFELIDVAVGSM